MSVIYVVGPSGAGKSALCKKLAEQGTHFIHVSLDAQVKRYAGVAHLNEIVHLPDGWAKFWNYCLQALHQICQIKDDNIYLVDAGAGSLQTEQGRNYFIERAKNLVCVTGNEDVIYGRNSVKIQVRGDLRSKDDFMKTEYSPERRAVYEAAQYAVNTTKLDLNASLHTFQEVISAILQHAD